jgi:hypothetical protein
MNDMATSFPSMTLPRVCHDARDLAIELIHRGAFEIVQELLCFLDRGRQPGAHWTSASALNSGPISLFRLVRSVAYREGLTPFSGCTGLSTY